jgi:2-polyprenyl-3-methyl-5-hydroxy-6-metoxy-1,4-benzoquinol methylase
MLTTHAEPLPVRPRSPSAAAQICRLCGARSLRGLLDLGCIPLANRTIAPSDPDQTTYPLNARICDSCQLVQIQEVASAEIIATPNQHAVLPFPVRPGATRRYPEIMRKRLRLDSGSLVIEVGSSDGSLLRQFSQAGIPVLGIEPCVNAANTAIASGVPTEIGLFSTETAMEIAVRYGSADLVIANNVLPHAPDLFDFAAGFGSILRPNGILTLEVPHLLALVQRLQFDAFRHDSYTYLSLRVLEHVLRSVGLRVFDAERLPEYGGMLRVHACHAVAPYPARSGLKAVRMAEGFVDLERRDFFSGFNDRVTAARDEIREFLGNRQIAGRRVAAYGAVTRGITMLNGCGITASQITFVADPDPARHGHQIPGSRIPIRPVEALTADLPDDVIILAWPNATEIAAQLQTLSQKGTQLWTMIPKIARV